MIQMQINCCSYYNMNIFSEVTVTSDGLGFYTNQSIYKVFPEHFLDFLNYTATRCSGKLIFSQGIIIKEMYCYILKFHHLTFPM